MFTLRQIASAGFVSVYAGCVTLTVNLYRIPYRRGAFVGVGFAALMHVVVAFLYLLIAIQIGNGLDDPLLKQKATWGIILACILGLQILSAIGCTIMGRYFLSPASGKDKFDREKLYQQLKSMDTGKRSVLHDVIQILETTPAKKDRKFSSLWILLLGLLSVGAMGYWLQILTDSSLNVLFMGVQMDIWWGLSIVAQFCIPVILLVATNLAMIAWLGRE